MCSILNEDNHNYLLPDCIIQGSLNMIKLMVKCQNIICELSRKRGYGVTERFLNRVEVTSDNEHHGKGCNNVGASQESG